MKRVEIALKDLKPNPFKKFIRNGELDEDQIEGLRESIRQTGFWDNVVVRKTKDGYELQHGHHRVEAAKRELGKNYVASLALGDYTDAQMLQGMANENATGRVESTEAQMDVVVTVREFLRNGSSVGDHRQRQDGKGQFTEMIASAQKVADFLNNKKAWSRRKVDELFQMWELLDPEVKKSLHTNKRREASDGLGYVAGLALTQLPKETQRAVVGTAKKEKVLATTDIAQVVKDVKEEKKSNPKLDVHRTTLKKLYKKVEERKIAKAAPKAKAKASTKKDDKDVKAIVAALLPKLRKLRQTYRMITEAIEQMEQQGIKNPMLDPHYANNMIIGDFKNVTAGLIKDFYTIFGSNTPAKTQLLLKGETL